MSRSFGLGFGKGGALYPHTVLANGLSTLANCLMRGSLMGGSSKGPSECLFGGKRGKGSVAGVSRSIALGRSLDLALGLMIYILICSTKTILSLA